MAQALDIIGRLEDWSPQATADTIRLVLNNYLSGLQPEPVFECVENLSYAYNNMCSENVEIDFGNEGTRIAYMYMYFMQHCFAVYSVLCHLQQDIQDQFDSPTEELKVCCIGGGPGTDLVALILFLQEKRMLPKSMHCTIVDKQTEWKDTWDKIWKDFPKKPEPENFQIQVSYLSCDLLETEDLPEGVLNAVSEAHIITMITTYSHLFYSYKQKNGGNNPTELPRLKMILDKMAKESAILFIDKDNVFNLEEHFWKNHAEPADMDRVLDEPLQCTQSIRQFRRDYSEYSNIDHYHGRMPKSPMSQSEVTANIFKHKNDIEELEELVEEL